MKTKKIKWVTLHLLGIGIALGSSIGMHTGYAQELVISNGDTVMQDVIGIPGGIDEVKMDQSSTWQGNLSVDQAGGAQIDISEGSHWEGEISSNRGYANVEMKDSTWNGDVYAVGDQENGYPAEISVYLNNSQWVGNTIVEEGNFYLILEDNSSLSGDVQVTNGYNHLGVANSSKWDGSYSVTATEGYASGYVDVSDHSLWKGDANMLIDSTAQNGNLSTHISNNSQWQGNMELVASNDVPSYGIQAQVSIYDNSSWIGNADLTGGFYANLGMNSHWQGNVKVENGEYLQSSSNYMSIFDSSSWQGSIEVTHMNSDYATLTYINLGMNSQWVGDMKATGNVGASIGMYDSAYWKGNLELNYGDEHADTSISSVNLGTNSQWIGNMTVSGDVYILANIYDNSLWIGDLDVSQDTMVSDYQTGQISLADQSTWQGKIISGDNNNNGLYLSMANESNWNMTDSSKLTSFFANYSTISFLPQGTGKFSTLTVDGEFMSDENLFVMNTDLAANMGDLIDIKGPISGGSNSKIQVNNQGSAWVNTDNELTIVTTTEDEDADYYYFTLNNQVEVGGFEYGLKQVGSNWNLYSTRNLTSTAQGSMNLVGGSYLLNYAENQTLLQRMGELRDSEHKQGIWARVYGGKFTSSKDGMLDGYKMTYTGLQVGRDKKFDLGENKGDIYFGGMFGYGKASLDYGNGSGNVDSKTLGLYGTYINPNGFYADAVLKYNKMKNEYKVLDTAGVGIKGEDIDTDGVHFSLEVGQRIHFDREEKTGWYLEPQAQISVGRVTSGEFTASNGLRVHVDDYNTVLGRVGMLAGYEVKSGKNPINVYGKVSYVHEFDGDVGYRFNGISVNDSFGDSWIVYGVGANAQIGKSHNLYLDIERASGGQFNQPWAINGGYRFTW